MLSKKAISPVVATALLLVVAVVAVVGFQGWFGDFSSKLNAKTETQSSINTFNTDIESVVASDVYFKNSGTENITINAVKLNGVDCGISGDYPEGISEIDLSLCMQNVEIGEAEVVIYTDSKIYSEKFILKSIPTVCSGNDTLGTGTLLNPFGICDCTDLQNVSNNLSGNYKLYSDVDCSATLTWNSGAGFLPIGAYTGTFDGNNHTISNLYILRNTSDNIALFSNIADSSIKNVYIESPQIIGDEYVGVLVANVTNSTITNVHVTNGSVFAKHGASFSFRGTGGVIATLSGSPSILSELSYNGIISSNGSEVGGVLGSCYSTGSYLEKSYANVNIYGIGNSTLWHSIRVGGLVGEIYNNCTINTSYSITNLNSTHSVLGGLVGGAHTGSIHNSYSFANISCNGTNCNNQIGGILGWSQNENVLINNTFFVGNITGFGGYSGAAIDYHPSGVYNSFYNSQVFTFSDGGGGTAKNTSQMQNTTTFTSAGWDTSIWTLVNGSYPRLYWE